MKVLIYMIIRKKDNKPIKPKTNRIIPVRYTTFSTVAGEYFIAATKQGICKLHWPADDKLIRYISTVYGCIPVYDPNYFTSVTTQLRDYLTGKLKEFDCQLDLSAGTRFQKKCWNALLKIPYGQVRTYRWVAEEAGSPKAYRAAGQAVHNNPIPLIVPCHRVIGKDGSMVGYGGPSELGQKRKLELLVMEGAIPPGQGKITKYKNHRE